jgi:hypothetical protein
MFSFTQLSIFRELAGMTGVGYVPGGYLTPDGAGLFATRMGRGVIPKFIIRAK